jgi:hypothetical protein
VPDSNYKYSRVKIGDGKHTLQELPFLVESITNVLLDEYKQDEEFDAGRITKYF